MSKLKILAYTLSLLLTQITGAHASSSASKATSLIAQSEKTNHAIVQSPNDKRHYKAIRLKNDLQVLLICDPDLKNSAASLSVDIGSMDNPDSQLGLAH